jgi:hypothetical protein
LPDHLSKRLERAVFAQSHEQGKRLLPLLLVERAVERDIAVIKFF